MNKSKKNWIPKSILIVFFLLINIQSNFAKKSVSITIDIPNTNRYAKDGYYSPLLNSLNSLSIPIAIFINEGLLNRGDSISRKFNLLIDWFKRIL